MWHEYLAFSFAKITLECLKKMISSRSTGIRDTQRVSCSIWRPTVFRWVPQPHITNFTKSQDKGKELTYFIMFCLRFLDSWGQRYNTSQRHSARCETMWVCAVCRVDVIHVFCRCCFQSQGIFHWHGAFSITQALGLFVPWRQEHGSPKCLVNNTDLMVFSSPFPPLKIR